MLSVVLLPVLLACASCSPRTPARVAADPPAPPPDVAGLLAPGCYRCLEGVMDVARRSPEARFQVALLLAVRAKELGLPFDAWLAEATEVRPLDPEWQTYLDIAASVRIDPLSGDREAIMTLTQQQRRTTAVVREWRTTLIGGAAAPLFRAYLDVTLACSLSDEERTDAITAWEARLGPVPLLQYRIGTCRSASHLESLRAGYPEFADADLPLGRNALDSSQPDQEEALRRFAAAAEAFPASPVILASIGSVRQDREEWSDALVAYDAALALVPTHRDALLGRAVALSNLSRHDEAIAATNRLVELGTWYLGGAYFWRAWNEYHLNRLAEARADLDGAKARSASPATLALSGLVAWRQGDLALAARDLEDALRIDAGQCESAVYLGGVQLAREQWTEAAGSFQHAGQCFDLSIALRRKLIAEVAAGPGSETGKAGQIARHERAIAEALRNKDEARQGETAVRQRLP